MNVPHVQEVIIAYETRGKGTPDDPMYKATVVYTLDGEHIAESVSGSVGEK